MSSVKGCVSVGLQGNSYLQHSELRWNNKSVKQGMKYQVLNDKKNPKSHVCLCVIAAGALKKTSFIVQRGSHGMHSLQFTVGLEKVSPAPCPSHTLLVKIQTDLKEHMEHTVLLGLCPPQPVSPF